MKQDLKTTTFKGNNQQGQSFFSGNTGGSFFQPAVTQGKTQDAQKSFDHAPLVQMQQNGGMSHPDRPPVPESTGLDNALANGGLTVALYVSGESPFSDQGTFEAEANNFARDHNAVMIENNQAVFGEAAATPVSHIGDIVSRCRQVSESASQMTGQEVKIQTLALFTHGLTSYLNFGGGNLIANDQATAEEKHRGVHNSMRRQEERDARRGEANGVSPYQARSSEVEEIETTEGFAAAINNYLANDARVVMYACLTGSTYNDAEGAAARGSRPDPNNARNARERRKLERRRAAVDRIRGNERRLNRARNLVEEDHESGGEGSFADNLRDALNAEGQERQIWGHRTTAHTTGNPTWRVFEGQQQEEEQASNPLFATHSLLNMDRARTSMANQVGEYLQSHFQQRVAVNRNLRVWIARELPFVPSNLQPYITEWRGRTPVFTDGLIAHLAGRYMQQRGNQ